VAGTDDSVRVLTFTYEQAVAYWADEGSTEEQMVQIYHNALTSADTVRSQYAQRAFSFREWLITEAQDWHYCLTNDMNDTIH